MFTLSSRIAWLLHFSEQQSRKLVLKSCAGILYPAPVGKKIWLLHCNLSRSPFGTKIHPQEFFEARVEGIFPKILRPSASIHWLGTYTHCNGLGIAELYTIHTQGTVCHNSGARSKTCLPFNWSSWYFAFFLFWNYNSSGKTWKMSWNQNTMMHFFFGGWEVGYEHLWH